MCNSKYQELHRLKPGSVYPGMRYDDVMNHASTPLVSSQMVRGIEADNSTRTTEAKLEDGRWLQINGTAHQGWRVCICRNRHYLDQDA